MGFVEAIFILFILAPSGDSTFSNIYTSLYVDVSLPLAVPFPYVGVVPNKFSTYIWYFPEPSPNSSLIIGLLPLWRYAINVPSVTSP